MPGEVQIFSRHRFQTEGGNHSFVMSNQTQAPEKAGILEISGGVRTEEAALAIKAGLEDLPGVHGVEVQRDGVRIRFNPNLAHEQKFYEAVKIAGYHASTFREQ